MKLFSKLFLFFLIMLLSGAQCQSTILNENLVNQSSSKLFVLFEGGSGILHDTDKYFLSPQGIHMTQVQHRGRWRSIKRIISVDTFDYFSNTEDYKQNQINKELDWNFHDYQSYLVDEKFIYIFACCNFGEDSVDFRVLGGANNFNYLGGGYALYKDAVYFNGRQIESADSQTFKVIPVISKIYKLGFIPVGVDKNNVYLYEKKASNELLVKHGILEKFVLEQSGRL